MNPFLTYLLTQYLKKHFNAFLTFYLTMRLTLGVPPSSVRRF